MLLEIFYFGFFIFGFAAIFLALAGLAVLIWLKVPFAPTPKHKVRQIIDLFELKPSQKFYDLGCGDGRFISEAAKRGAKAVGYEISPWVFLRTKTKLILTNSPAKIFFKNFYNVSLADADAVFCFLVDKVMQKVENKLIAELKSGAKVVCYGFALPNWPPKKIIDSGKSKIYLYIK